MTGPETNDTEITNSTDDPPCEHASFSEHASTSGDASAPESADSGPLRVDGPSGSEDAGELAPPSLSADDLSESEKSGSIRGTMSRAAALRGPPRRAAAPKLQMRL